MGAAWMMRWREEQKAREQEQSTPTAQPVAVEHDDKGRVILTQEQIDERIDIANRLGNPADFSNTNLKFKKLNGEMYRANFENADLSFADMRKANAEGANFKNAILEQTEFNEAELTGAVFTSAKAESAYFERANLRYAMFRNTEAPYADFSGAIFHEADLTGAKFNHAKMKGAHFDHATIFNGAVFDHADLSESFFAYVNRCGAHLQAVSCVQTKFTNAKMRHVIMAPDSNYEGADFTGADEDKTGLKSFRYSGCRLGALDNFFKDMKRARDKGIIISR